MLSHSGVLPPLQNPNPSVKPAAAQSCAVLGARCVQGCAIPVAIPLRSRAPARQGCTTKTASQPCIEDVAGGATKFSTAKALRELQATERLLDRAAPRGASPSFCRPLFGDLPTKRLPTARKSAISRNDRADLWRSEQRYLYLSVHELQTNVRPRANVRD